MSFETLRFDGFELDRPAYQLRRNGQVVHLERIPLDLLFLLAERRGQLVTRQEILDHVWGKDVFLDVDNSINTAVRKIRLALQDNPEAPRFVLTVPAKGYRFVALIENAPAPTSTAVPAPAPAPAHTVAAYEARPKGRWRPLLLTLTLLTLPMGLAAFVYFRRVHALSDKDTIVLSDFTNTTGDVIFDGTLREGLAVELEQSPFLNLIPDGQIQQTLRMMRQPSDTRLTPELAHQVCHRTNSAAVLENSISQIGSQYHLVLKAVNCSTGESIASTEAQASDKNHILGALRDASSDIRRKLGESRATLQKFDAPLAQATTASLPALRAYSFGLSKYGKGDQTGAIPLFQQAIELDPDFAMAYANLGRSYQVLANYDRMYEPLRKAFALRDHASERERFDIVAAYHQFVTLRTDLTIQNCELWEQSYPRDFTPHRILGFENAVLGRYERSAVEFRKAMEVDPTQALPYAGLMRDYMTLNRLAEARVVYQQAQARGVNAGEVDRIGYNLAFLENDSDAMTQLAAALSKEPGYEYRALWEESKTATYFGHLAAARQFSQHSADKALEQKDLGTAARVEADQSIRESLFGNSAEAHRHLATAMRLGEDPSFYMMALALSGDTPLSTTVLDSIARRTPPEGFVDKATVPEFRAAIELKRGNPARALQLLAAAEPYESGWFDLYMAAYLRGQAHLALHHGQEAAAEFQKILAHRGVVWSEPIGAIAHLGLARAYALQGDTANARSAYNEFLTLWKDADPNIPILKQARAEYGRLP